ncbi:hypothetical protein E2C01_027696 [Portunus trituberculatus]|uniref:Uncharacterized protein n=1 Tax=Portunus trituberculatus TaxID=210409 RepID=A0A5B7EIT0_PORTR|nr:hypothetical protein [Portunus trituberculatus]
MKDLHEAYGTEYTRGREAPLTGRGSLREGIVKVLVCGWLAAACTVPEDTEVKCSLTREAPTASPRHNRLSARQPRPARHALQPRARTPPQPLAHHSNAVHSHIHHSSTYKNMAPAVACPTQYMSATTDH